uniref:Dicer-like 3/4 n=1 Tax=Paramecium bursaria TaxID=74790 RepID=A0A8G1FVK2_9CILI|nr:dicer-like 3/4 [Paramecium bursaria]
MAKQFLGYLPPQISSKYERPEKKENVIIYLNQFQISQDESILIISPQLVQYPKGTIQLFGYEIQMKKIISSQRSIPLLLFKQIVEFNIYLFSDLYRVNSKNAIALNSRSLYSYFQEQEQRMINLLVVPGHKDIDWQQLKFYLQFKNDFNKGKDVEEDQTKDIPKTLVCKDNQFQTFCVMKYIPNPEISLDELLDQFVEMKIFQTKEEAEKHFNFNKDDTYLWEAISKKEKNDKKFECQQKVNDLIQKNGNLMPLVLLCESSMITQFHELSNGDFYYCKECDESEELYALQNCSFFNQKSQKMILSTLSQLKHYPISVSWLNLVARLYNALVCQIKIFSVTCEALYKVEKLAKFDDMIQAISAPIFSIQQNYENLELVGDSVLKYIVTAFLYLDPKFKDETLLSKQRSRYIKNNALIEIFKKSDIRILNTKIHFKTVRNPIAKEVKQEKHNKDQCIEDSQYADIYEAITGACFVNTYKLSYAMSFLKKSKFIFPKISDQFETEEHFNVLDQLYEDKKKANIYIQNGNTQRVFNQKVPQINSKNKEETQPSNEESKDIIEQLERLFSGVLIIPTCGLYNSIIKEYPFKKMKEQKPFNLNPKFRKSLFTFKIKSIKKEAFIMRTPYSEKLEFLGDAVLELLIVSNCYRICERHYYTDELKNKWRNFKGQRTDLLCPGMLHTCKISLLDTGFMGMMALYHGFHEYAKNISEQEMKQLIKIMEQLQNEPFDNPRTPQNYSTIIPKYMADLWEQVAGQVLLDYGWDALINFYGEIYQPFIDYICNNILDIYDVYQIENREKQFAKNNQQFK